MKPQTKIHPKVNPFHLPARGFIPSFTLIEIAVVLIISGSVMTMAMWSYNNGMKYLRTYLAQEETNQELALFITHFTRDLDVATGVSVKRGNLILENSNMVNEYAFFTDILICYQENQTDTFRLPVVLFDYQTDAETEQLITRIDITLGLPGLTEPLTFYKTYQGQTYFYAHEY